MDQKIRNISSRVQDLLTERNPVITEEGFVDPVVSPLQAIVKQLKRLQDLSSRIGNVEANEFALAQSNELSRLLVSAEEFCNKRIPLRAPQTYLQSGQFSVPIALQRDLLCWLHNLQPVSGAETGETPDAQKTKSANDGESDRLRARRSFDSDPSVYFSKENNFGFALTFASLIWDIENLLRKLCQLLQVEASPWQPQQNPVEEISSPDSDGQEDFQMSMTHMLLWKAYEEDLYRALLASHIEGSVSRSVLIVVRKVLMDKSRLSPIQLRMITANCRRRRQFTNTRERAHIQGQLPAVQNSENDDSSRSNTETTSLTTASDVFVVTRITPSRLLAVPGDDWDYPDAPKSIPGSNACSCPYCGQLLDSTTFSSSKRWRQHILDDVLPYVCIFDECPRPFVMYSSVKNWLAHMEHEHSGRQWICYGCSPSEPRVFDTREKYCQHFSSTRQHIGNTMESQLETLARLNEIARPLKFKSCPLCRWTKRSDPGSVLRTTMQRHIIDHIFAFAMLSLQSDTEADGNSPVWNQVPSTGRLFASNGDSQLSFELESLSTLEFHSEPDHISVGSEQYEGEPTKAVVAGGMTEPMVPAENQMHSLVLRQDSTSNVLKSRWRKALLLGCTIATFYAAGKRLRTRLMCHYCRQILEAFHDIDIKISYMLFKYHENRQDMYMSARAGCSLCMAFIKAVFGDAEEGNYQGMVINTQDEKATSFSFVFSGRDSDKRLQMWDTCHPQELLYEFEIYCSRDSGLSRVDWTMYRPLFTDPSSEEALELLRERYDRCCDKHDLCRSASTVWPKRLVDVGYPIRIVEPQRGKEPPPKFLYLSACWGGDFALRLTASNYSVLREEIVLEKLPKTIRDAILVARGMQIPYIWVDSLCILQDSLSDWSGEAGLLKDYLQGCAFTLGAASSPSLAAGFLNFRDDQRCYTFDITSVGSLAGTKVHIRPSLPPVWNSLSRSPLFSRLWTLQELTVCSRSIFFGSSNIVWNCRTLMISEASQSEMQPLWNGRLGIDALLDSPSILKRRSSANPSQSQNSDPDSLNRNPSSSNVTIYESWHKIVEYSSRLKVTFERDRLPALSALASITAAKLDQDMYLAGLWKNNLHHDLLWHRANTALTRTAYSNIPSWSWAAYTGRISYSLRNLLRLDVTDTFEHTLRPSAEIKKALLQLKGPDPFGDVGVARIHIEAAYIGRDALFNTMELDFFKKYATWVEQIDLTNETLWEGSLSEFEPTKTDEDPKIAKEHRDRTAYRTEAIKNRKGQEAVPPAANQDLSEMGAKSHWMRPLVKVIFISETRLGDRGVFNALMIEPGDGLTYKRLGIGILVWNGLIRFSDFGFDTGKFELV